MTPSLMFTLIHNLNCLIFKIYSKQSKKYFILSKIGSVINENIVNLPYSSDNLKMLFRNY